MKSWSKFYSHLQLIIAALLVPCLFVACGQPKRTTIKKMAKGKITNPNTKMSAETCSKKKPAMILGLDGQCMQKEECSSSLGMAVNGDHCVCDTGMTQSSEGNSCVEESKKEDVSTDKVDASQRKKNIEKAPGKKGSMAASPAEKSVDKNASSKDNSAKSVQADSMRLAFEFKGSGTVNITCGTQNSARIEQLNLSAKVSESEELPESSWTMGVQDFFTPKLSKELKASAVNPLTQGLKIMAKCLIEDCGAFEFLMSGQMGTQTVEQVFYGVLNQNCQEDSGTSARPFTVSNSKPE